MSLRRIPCDTWHDILHGKTSHTVRPRMPAPPLMRAATLNYSELRAMLNAPLHFRNCMLRDPGESAGALRSRAHRGGTAQARTGSARPHLHRELGFTPPESAPGLWAQPARICTGTGLTPPTTAPGLWAQPCHICTRTGLTPPTTAPGLWAQPCHICTGTLGSALPHLQQDFGLSLATSALGLLGSPCSYLHQDF